MSSEATDNAMRAEVEDLPRMLVKLARQVEALKAPCGMDPESPTAVRNSGLMAVSYALRHLSEAARADTVRQVAEAVAAEREAIYKEVKRQAGVSRTVGGAARAIDIMMAILARSTQ